MRNSLAFQENDLMMTSAQMEISDLYTRHELVVVHKRAFHMHLQRCLQHGKASASDEQFSPGPAVSVGHDN